MEKEEIKNRKIINQNLLLASKVGYMLCEQGRSLEEAQEELKDLLNISSKSRTTEGITKTK